MNTKFVYDEFIKKYPYTKDIIKKESIKIDNLNSIFDDFVINRGAYGNHAEFIANILRSKAEVHTVKSRIKEPERLIEKIIRKTGNRKNKYDKEFQFTINNYKDEINDLIGIRVIHIFKEQWQEIHEFITKTWKVIEVTANVRAGDNTKIFEELGIEVCSRISGYRSVHYLVEFYPTNKRVIAEIQVRTIFEEGYGEIDHKLRYSHNKIPDILKANLLLFNRIVGSADEMASLISNFNKEIVAIENEYKNRIQELEKQIEMLK